MNIVGILVGLLLGALFSGLVIWIVGKLGLGMEVSGFGPAYLAAIVIAVLNAVVAAILSALGVSTGVGFVGVLVNLIIAALILMTAGKWIRGLRVNGFLGALVGAVAIAAVGWLIVWLVGTLL